MVEVYFHKLISKEPYYTSLSFLLFPVAIYTANFNINKSYTVKYDEFVSYINKALDSFLDLANYYSQSNKSLTSLSLTESLPFGELDINFYKLINQYRTSSDLPQIVANDSPEYIFKLVNLGYIPNYEYVCKNFTHIKLDITNQSVSIIQPKDVSEIVDNKFYIWLFVDIGNSLLDLTPISLFSAKTSKDANQYKFATVMKSFFERLL